MTSLLCALVVSMLVLCGASVGQEGPGPLAGDADQRLFTDQWAVHIEGGDPVADLIAQRHGFINLGKVSQEFSLSLSLCGI